MISMLFFMLVYLSNFFVVIGVKVDLNEGLGVRKLDTFNPNFVG